MPRGRYSLARPASALAAHKPLLLSNPLLPAHTRISSAKTSWQSHGKQGPLSQSSLRRRRQSVVTHGATTPTAPQILVRGHCTTRVLPLYCQHALPQFMLRYATMKIFSLSTFILSALMPSVSKVPSEQSLPPFPLPARRPLHPRKRVPLSHRPSLLHYHRLASQVKHHVRSRRSESSPSPVARPSLSGQCETLPSQEVPHVRSTIHGTTRPNP
ncbi:hypothetical protein IWZ00DRAFT_498533, partial [Phyllosticta capitalensis]